MSLLYDLIYLLPFPIARLVQQSKQWLITS